jgi:beta-lactamase class A
MQTRALPGRLVLRAAALTAAFLLGSVASGPASAQPHTLDAATKTVEARIAKSGAEVALAFRTLDGKDEWLVRPDEVFHAASTMKTPVMIELFHCNDAIPAGLPPGTPVARKTGSIAKIHHDAAIVYGPRPFVLAILVRGLTAHGPGSHEAPCCQVRS